jgi:hypothetical protein
MVLDVDIERNPPAGCMGEATSCDGQSTITIKPTATDDRTSTADMGYELTLLSGSLPSRHLSLPESAVDGWGGVLYLSWGGDTGDGLSFTLGVRAVDRAGNRGPITEIKISRGSGGCEVGSRAASNGALWMAVFAWLVVRRRAVAAAHLNGRRFTDTDIAD